MRKMKIFQSCGLHFMKFHGSKIYLFQLERPLEYTTISFSLPEIHLPPYDFRDSSVSLNTFDRYEFHCCCASHIFSPQKTSEKIFDSRFLNPGLSAQRGFIFNNKLEQENDVESRTQDLLGWSYPEITIH